MKRRDRGTPLIDTPGGGAIPRYARNDGYSKFLPGVTTADLFAAGSESRPPDVLCKLGMAEPMPTRQTFLRWLLGSMPLPSIAFEQGIGFFRAPIARGVFWNGCGFGGAPDV